MQALRLILFGVVLALFALFSFNNWVPVPVVLPDGAKILISLPIVVFVAFLLGWLPVLLLHLASRAASRRRLAKVERLLEDALSGARATPPMTAMPPSTLAAQGQPTVVPPA